MVLRWWWLLTHEHIYNIRGRHKAMCQLETHTDFAWKCTQECRKYFDLVEGMLIKAEGKSPWCYRPSSECESSPEESFLWDCLKDCMLTPGKSSLCHWWLCWRLGWHHAYWHLTSCESIRASKKRYTRWYPTYRINFHALMSTQWQVKSSLLFKKCHFGTLVNNYYMTYTQNIEIKNKIIYTIRSQ